jgi:ribonuclease HI
MGRPLRWSLRPFRASVVAVLTTPSGSKYRYATCLSFTNDSNKCTNNIVEYEAIILGFCKLRALRVRTLSGTIIRGTPRLLISAGNPHQHKDAKAWWVRLNQGSVHSRDTISPRPSLASGKGSRPRRIHVSPEGPLKQRTHLRLARGPVFAKKQPWPDHHTDRPYRRSI